MYVPEPALGSCWSMKFITVLIFEGDGEL